MEIVHIFLRLFKNIFFFFIFAIIQSLSRNQSFKPKYNPKGPSTTTDSTTLPTNCNAEFDQNIGQILLYNYSSAIGNLSK